MTELQNMRFGMIFIVEGETDEIFYLHYLKSLCGELNWRYEETFFLDYPALIIHGKDGSIAALFENIGGIGQISRADAIAISCTKSYPIDWHVFLCYDTDDYNAPISKFHEGDWKYLRDNLEPLVKSVTDLSARADIEDVMLSDLPNILCFLHLDKKTKIPLAKKGKTKMKRLFRLADEYYHEGERARTLIESLDRKSLLRNSSIHLSAIDARVVSLADS